MSGVAIRAAVATVVVLGASGTRVASAGPTIVVGAEVPAERRVEVERIDHGEWSALLRKYVDGDGRVDYATWKSSAADVRTLDAYLSRLSSARFERNADRAVGLAFWINAYNAVTVRGILREYPTTSIRNHTAKVFGYNIWKDLKLSVDGKAYSLEAIEHEVLRKAGEPRIHFAIVCASIGCPRLLNEAYVAPRLNEQLSSNARHFFADPQKFSYDRSTGTVRLSPILKWFAEDFGADQSARLRTIGPYLPADSRAAASDARSTVAYLDYDWNLNDRSTAQRNSSR